MRLSLLVAWLGLMCALIAIYVRAQGISERQRIAQYRQFPTEDDSPSPKGGKSNDLGPIKPPADGRRAGSSVGDRKAIAGGALPVTSLRDYPPADGKLPSHDELFDAMAPYRKPEVKHKWPWGVANPPWVPDDTKGVFPPSTQRRWRINQFTLDDGRAYGPYGIGGSKFEAKPYPHDLPYLKHNYLRGNVYPFNFEDALRGNRFLISESIYRPDPRIMKLVSDKIKAPLAFNGWTPEAVGLGAKVKQGEFLWPPVKVQRSRWSAGLDMDRGIRQHLYTGALTELYQHRPGSPRVWHMTIKQPGYDTERHIMMTKAPAEAYTDLAHPSRNSDFWLLHEAGLDKYATHPKMSLIGGMFLPKGAAETLYQGGWIRPAFVNMVGHAH